MLEFPSYEQARGWYDPPEYQKILPLRTDNSDGVIMLLAGVDRDHVATDILS